MDKRNHEIHGNYDPEREKLELVYFAGKRPLFAESGDHFGRFFEAIEHQHKPEAVIRDYEDTYAFLLEIISCLKPGLAKSVWRIMEDRYPGYEINRKMVGALFPDYVIGASIPNIRYDDELAVTWSYPESSGS